MSITLNRRAVPTILAAAVLAAPASASADADIRLQMSATTTTPLVGQQFAYRIQVFNDGPDDATGVVVDDTLPAGIEFVSAPSFCTHVAGSVKCTVGNVPRNSSGVGDIVVRPTTPGPITNRATAGGSQADPAPGNNSAEVTVTVLGGANNRSPVARCDRYFVKPGKTLKIPASGVMKNDSDPDGDAMSAVLAETSFPRKRLVFKRNGGFTFRPYGKRGIARIAYFVRDSKGARSQRAYVYVGVGLPVGNACSSSDEVALSPYGKFDHGWITRGHRCFVRDTPSGVKLLYGQARFQMWADEDSLVEKMTAKARLIPAEGAGHNLLRPWGPTQEFKTNFSHFKADFKVNSDTGNPGYDWDLEVRMRWVRSGVAVNPDRTKTLRIRFNERSGACEQFDSDPV